ncbi:MAG: tRNA pseudouridine(55) synthase TruB [Burkholderiales bacterium]|nr:tRNA pseudouridine(55) synthase TruB [Burkholderiales bacterium]MCE7877691.1 tRNA pseudouridine(55) synthase TruB [Betaproteobacteria bacterium PRO3]
MTARVPRRRVDGVLLVDKPAGLTSNAALQCAKRLYRAQKAGHTGTLDPLATGLLPIAFGEATKLAHALLDAPKRYEAVVRFGAATDTGDAEGAIVRTAGVPQDRAVIDALLPRFTGTIRQTPPRHAALKHQGRAYYDWTRAGVEVPRTAREVVIHAFAIRDWQSPDLTVEVACSKGTYIRVLAEDLGDAADSCAHLAALRRTATGGFAVSSAVALERLEAMTEAERDTLLLPPDVLVGSLPRVDLQGPDAARFSHGGAAPAPRASDGRVAVFAGSTLLGLADVRSGWAHPARVLVPGA